MKKVSVVTVLLSLVVILLTLSSTSLFATVYVKRSGNDSNDGSSWDTAKRTIQAGIDAAHLKGGDEVWVAACPDPPRAYVGGITLKENVHLYGGFAGTETDRNQRNWVANETIIYGDHYRSVVTALNLSVARIDGFTIRDGWNHGGGGVQCHNSSPTITNNTITRNSAADVGGGISCGGGSPMITNNTITRNRGGKNLSGGGICCYGYSSPTISNNTITYNSANSGGGISCFNYSSPVISNNSIADNSVSNYGGGIYCDFSSPTIINNTITCNSASYDGGAISCWWSSSPTITNNTITRNSASQYGGAISCFYTSSPIIRNMIFFGNRAPKGGCVFKYDNVPSFSYCCFYDNGDKPFYPTDWNPIGSNNNFEGNPLFLAPWVEEYHLRPGSPCIDTGNDLAVDPAWADLDGKTRILGAHVDIGCFEWDKTPYWVRRVDQAKAVPEGFSIELKRKPITAAFGSAFYIEEPNRSAGLRIVSAAAAAPGDFVTVAGQLIIDDDEHTGERALQPTSVSIELGSKDNIPGPLGMPNRSVGGGDFFWNYNGENCGQQGITDTYGLNNMGLLIKTSGRVTLTGHDFFYLDDGSEVSIKCLVPTGMMLPNLNDYVSVTGISSCEKRDGGKLLRLMRLRTQDDIVPF